MARWITLRRRMEKWQS